MAHRAVIRSTLAAAVAVLIFSGGSQVAAHETEPGLALELHGVRPAVAGLEVEAREVLAPTLRVRNTTDEPFEVLGRDGVPFLRIGPDGIEANLASPDFYRSEAPAPSVSVPATATPGAAPRWVHLRDDAEWAWFEHRIAADRTAGSRWSIPARLGARDLELEGSWTQVRVRGAFRSVLEGVTPAVADLEVRLLPGQVPVIAVDNATGQTLTILDATGEASLRIGPDVAEQLDPGSGWRRVADQPRWVWPEPRAAWHQEQPPPEVVEATRPVRLGPWSVPASLGDRELLIEGFVEWVPTASHHTGTRWGLAALPAAAGAAVLLVVALRRRARARAAAGSPVGS